MRILALVVLLLGGCTAPKPGAEERAAPAAEEQPTDSAATVQSGHAAYPCLIQNGKPVSRKLKALGTEPFWAAEIEGRCVTYRTPEEQGTRIWTQVVETPDATVWNGALDRREFQLTVKPGVRCSDGMSDKIYSMEAVLRVRGETRHGCAAPASGQP